MSRWQENFPWTAAAIDFLWPEGPARRKRWLRIAVAVFAIVAVHALITAFAAARTARATDRFVAHWGRLDPAIHRPAPVEDAANKARAVRAATEVMALPSIRTRPGGPGRIWESFASDPQATFTAADRDEMRKAVADNERALSLLDLAAERPGANWDLHYEEGIEVNVPPLLKILQLAKLNGAAGRLAVEERRIEDALVAFRRGSAIAASLANEPIAIVQAVRLAVDRLDAALARRILGTATLRPEQLAELEAACPVRDPRGDLRQAMIVEAKAMSGMLRTGVGAATYLSRRSDEGSPLTFGIVRAVARPYLLREERLWLEAMTARIERLERPRHARRKETGDPALRPWDELVEMMLGNLASLEERGDLAESRDGLLHAAIGIERRRLETGIVPATPADPEPVDPLTGRPFAYETDGTRWRIRSEADLSSMESARRFDPVLDWSRKN